MTDRREDVKTIVRRADLEKLIANLIRLRQDNLDLRREVKELHAQIVLQIIFGLPEQHAWDDISHH